MYVGRLLLCGVLILQAACTSNPKNIQAEYVSPRLYSSFSCEELFDELRKIQTKVDDLTRRQRSNRKGDTAMVTIGIIGFPFTWPVLLGTTLTKDRKREIAQYMGQVEAIRENIEIKKCAYQSRGEKLKLYESYNGGQNTSPEANNPDNNNMIVNEGDNERRGSTESTQSPRN